MRKVFLILILLTTGLLTGFSANKGTFYLKGRHYHEIHSISPNGKWACGVFQDNTINRAFVWNLENNEITYLGLKGLYTEAKGVSDNGVVCGTFITTEVDPNGAPMPTGGYWKEGKFYLLKDENGKPLNTMPEVITADGQYIAGSIIQGNSYKACVWKNGALERRLDSKGANAVPTAISDDGQLVAGFYMPRNRLPCYWDTELHQLSEGQSFDNTTYAISPNKKYILTRDDMGMFIYDTQTRERTDIPWLSDFSDNSGATAIMDDKTAILYELSGGALFATTYIYKADGTWKTMVNWLKDNWSITIPKEFTNPGITRFSRDMKRATVLTINGSHELYGEALYCPLAFISEQEIELARPTSLKANQIESTNNVLLTWTEPSANKDAVTGYRIFKNGTKLADVNFAARSYADNKIGAVKLNYEICALYNTSESEKISAEVNMKEMRYVPSPASFSTYQSNYDNVTLSWTKPNIGYDAAVKLHNDHFALPFGSSDERTFWAAVEFNKDLVSCYAGNFEIKAVEFYYCQRTTEMVLSISSGGKELLSQPIDQDQLVAGQNNVVVLKNPVAVPVNADVTVTIKVETSGAMPIGLADDPVVKGGNLISEDGINWTTLAEMSYDQYTYNWMIGMLLDSKDNGGVDPLAPSLRSATSPKLTGYKIYRDDAKIAEIKPEEMTQYTDLHVQPGRHVYGVEAIYDQTAASARKTSEIIAQKNDFNKCPAPTNLVGTGNGELKLSWDMNEYSEIGYTNWEYQAPYYYSSLSEWYYGVKFGPEKMKPYAGSKIVSVKFMPLENVTYKLAIFENGIEIYSQPIESYNLDKVNTVKLTTPVVVEPYTEYIAAIKVSNVGKEVKPIGLDTGYPYADGRQLSQDGSYFINAEVDMTGNAMISMEVEKTTAGYNPGMTYKVYIDGVAESQTVSDNKYTKSISDLAEPKTVSVNVAAVYPDGEKKSQDISVLVDPTSISSEEIVVVNVYPNPVTSSLNIVGNVSSASLFNMNGQEVNRIENENRMEVSSLPAGNYLLRSIVDGKTYTNKIQVVK